MKIGVYFDESKTEMNTGLGHFIVETLLLLASQNTADSFLLITRSEMSLKFDIPSNIETINLKARAGLWSELRLRLKLQQVLKRVKADLLVMINNDRLYIPSIPHCLIIGDTKKIRTGHLEKMKAAILFNKENKESLTRKNAGLADKIYLVYPGAGYEYAPINLNERQEIKTRYSDGMEYFLYNSSFDRDEDLVNLLKSFSQFKKRQQSSFKLLITEPSNSGYEKKIADYKYRNDVKFTGEQDSKIVAAAYAVVLPFNTNQISWAVFFLCIHLGDCFPFTNQH